MTSDQAAKQHEAFIALCDSVLKLARWRDFLTRPQAIALAETCRDLADAIDQGEGERGKRYLIPTRKKLINVGMDAQGRRLFRLTS